MNGVVAIVPLRDGTSGKSRLASSFSADGRATLIAAMARHVIQVLAVSGEIDTILVVTGDPDSAGYALGPVRGSVRIVRQPESALGLNGALAFGTCTAIASGATGVLIVPADLPILSPEDVRSLVAQSDQIAIAPDRRRCGTNALYLPVDGCPELGTTDDPSRRFVFQFGEGSYAAHITEAERLGMDAATLILDGTELDLDTIDDWQSLPAEARMAMSASLAHPNDLDTQADQYSCLVESQTRAALFPWS